MTGAEVPACWAWQVTTADLDQARQAPSVCSSATVSSRNCLWRGTRVGARLAAHVEGCTSRPRSHLRTTSQRRDSVAAMTDDYTAEP
jgi:hypothetical protein